MKKWMDRYKLQVSLVLALVCHIAIAVGIFFSSSPDRFIAYLPLNLVLMFLLLIWNQRGMQPGFLLFFLISFLLGMGTEMIGVHTGKLFGCHEYSVVLGPQLNGVPWYVGLHWFVVVYGAAIIMHSLLLWLHEKYDASGEQLSPALAKWSLILDGALLAVCFDWIMEPAAMELGLWHWDGSRVPLLNYLTWFLVSVSLMFLFRKFRFHKQNPFAIHLFILQGLFFLLQRAI